MWIFATRGFLSIVEHEVDTSLLHVRARFEGDIEALFPGARVKVTPAGDYLYRASIDRGIVAHVIAEQIRGITYRNFKSTILEHVRHRFYMRVWEVMLEAQRMLAPSSIWKKWTAPRRSSK